LDAETKTRSSIVERILKQPGANENEPREASKDIRPAVPTPMLDVVLRDGSIESFAYAYLTRVSFDPSGTLVLHFGEDKVCVEGRNLAELRQKLRLHKADEIVEGVEAEGMLKPQNASHIDRIRLEIAEEMKEVQHETRRPKSFVR